MIFQFFFVYKFEKFKKIKDLTSLKDIKDLNISIFVGKQTKLITYNEMIAISTKEGKLIAID